MEAMNIHASALAIVASKPLAVSERLMISMVHVPKSARACVSFSPA